MATTTEQGYGYTHQQERERWRPTVEAGRAICAEPICLMPSRAIHPGTPWDLAHNRNTGHYRGPAHRRCNRAEGARWKETLRQSRRTAESNTAQATGSRIDWHSRPWPG